MKTVIVATVVDERWPEQVLWVPPPLGPCWRWWDATTGEVLGESQWLPEALGVDVAPGCMERVGLEWPSVPLLPFAADEFSRQRWELEASDRQRRASGIDVPRAGAVIQGTAQEVTAPRLLGRSERPQSGRSGARSGVRGGNPSGKRDGPEKGRPAARSGSGGQSDA